MTRSMKQRVLPLAKKIDPLKCMGNWHVQVAVPTPFDKNAYNGLEQYTWNEKKQRVEVKYTFNTGSFTGKETSFYQVGRVKPGSDNGTEWQVAPWLGFLYSPVWLEYVIIDINVEDYSYMVCSSPEKTGMGAWMYIMTRDKVVTDEYLKPLKDIAAEAGWSPERFQRVPHQESN